MVNGRKERGRKKLRFTKTYFVIMFGRGELCLMVFEMRIFCFFFVSNNKPNLDSIQIWSVVIPIIIFD